MLDFVECDVCASKPGQPQLCNGCLRNRETIENLKVKLTPRLWSSAMDQVWHQSIPDLNKAFERLRELDV